MSTATLQLEFSELTKMLPVARQLVPIPVAMVLGDKGEDYVVAAIETGAIPFAWDIRGAAAAAREIRIWRQSLIAWLADPIADLRVRTQVADELAVVTSLFPHSREELKGTELQRLFSCGHSHIVNLVNDTLIQATTKPGPGPNGSPRITRASVTGFLLSRRVL